MGPSKEENGDETQSSTPEYRDRLRTWLIKMIDSGTIPGLHWENEEKTIFRMPWKHAGRQDYSLEDDSRIFMAWAIHSGRYREGIDKPEPIIWKTRLRCALNKMPDIREIPEKSRLDISEPYRVYHFLPPVHKDTQIRRRLQRRHSQAQNPENQSNTVRQTSPSYVIGGTHKEPIAASQSRKMSFHDDITQGRVEKTSPRSFIEFNDKPRLDFRSAAPWLGAPSLVPGAENSFFNRLNFGGLTSPLAVRNLISPYSLFSAPPRDLRHPPEIDFSMLHYPRQPLIENASLQSLFVPPTSLGRLPVTSKISNDIGINRGFAMENHLKQKMNHKEKAADRVRLGQNRLREEAKIVGHSRHHRSSEEKDDVPFVDLNRKSGVGSNKHGATTSPEKTKNVESVSSEKYYEAKGKIELLEKEIVKWKRAYDQEKTLRGSLERQHEHLKKNLENMGGDILAMIMRSYQTKENFDKRKQLPNEDGVNTDKYTSNLPLFRRRSDGDLRDSFSGSTTEACSIQGVQNNNNNDKSVSSVWPNQQTNRKRLTATTDSDSTKSRPLDLSSPPFKRKKDDVAYSFPERTKEISESHETTAIKTDKSSEQPFNKWSVPHWQYGPSNSANRLSSDYDDSEAGFSAVPTSGGKAIIVESPSTASTCSSSDDSLIGITRVSPATPLFRSDGENPYGNYKSRANGPIQVT